MKIWYNVLIVVLCLTPLMLFADSGFTITGKVTGIKSGYVSILSFGDAKNDNLESVHAERVRINDGEFVFKGKLDHPGLVRLKISTRTLDVFLENADYRIDGDLKTITPASLVGAEGNADLLKFNKSGLPMADFIKANPESIVSGYLALRISPEGFDLAKNCYESLHANVKHSWYGQQLKNIIERYEKSASIVDLPDLGLTDPEGEAFSLDQYKGKVVILDFWASWCAPCRAFIPKMKNLYTGYQDKPVAIVSISGDDNADDWKAAVRKEQMPWKQALSDGGFNDSGKMKQLLSIYHIPYVIVLDKNGKIAARLDFLQKEQLKSVVDKLL